VCDVGGHHRLLDHRTGDDDGERDRALGDRKHDQALEDGPLGDARLDADRRLLCDRT
jgi:hypothetical protein